MPEPYGCETDSELMGRFYQRDEAAFSALTERWWPRLFGYFRRFSFLNEDAEDLAQEVLVKLYLTRERQSFDVMEPLQPFLLAIARNLAIREWRGRKPDRTAVPLLEAVDVAGSTDAVPAELGADLFLCIWNLPEQQQHYVLLCGKHGLGELSHNEIATILGKWPAQLTQISQQARSNLRECLTSKGYR
jgi:RNA polymerase sigma factor (sigma-70 family)